jgi:hypothetical protein
VRTAWWQEQRDKVVNGFLVEPQNQGRVGTMWEPSHEWRLADATPTSRGLQWFTRKPLGYSVEPQNRDRRLDEEVWPPRLVQPSGPVRPPRPVRPPWSLAPRCFEAEDTRRDRKVCVEAKQVAVTGHPSDEQNLKTSNFALEGLVSLVIK